MEIDLLKAIPNFTEVEDRACIAEITVGVLLCFTQNGGENTRRGFGCVDGNATGQVLSEGLVVTECT